MTQALGPPVDGAFGMLLLEARHTVTFSVNRVEIGTFQTNPTDIELPDGSVERKWNGFKCRNDYGEVCMWITVEDGGRGDPDEKHGYIKLDEYFYSNREDCDMKPVPGVRDPKHGLILNETLEYIATITGKKVIRLEDESTRPVGVCPRVHVRVLKLARHKTFYEKVGHFQNQKMDERYEIARQQSVLDKGSIRQLAQKANIAVDGSDTLETLANKIITECGTPRSADSKSVSDLGNELRMICTRYLSPLFRNGDDEYRKTVSLRFRHAVEHSSNNERFIPYIGGPLYEFVRITIFPIVTGGSKKKRGRRSSKKRINRTLGMKHDFYHGKYIFHVQ